jgi:hypothetical protein
VGHLRLKIMILSKKFLILTGKEYLSGLFMHVEQELIDILKHMVRLGMSLAKYTRAKLFKEEGKRTQLFVRFSTVAGGMESPETARDPRGF